MSSTTKKTKFIKVVETPKPTTPKRSTASKIKNPFKKFSSSSLSSTSKSANKVGTAAKKNKNNGTPNGAEKDNVTITTKPAELMTQSTKEDVDEPSPTASAAPTPVFTPNNVSGDVRDVSQSDNSIGSEVDDRTQATDLLTSESGNDDVATTADKVDEVIMEIMQEPIAELQISSADRSGEEREQDNEGEL